jgi:hypothetical protein
MFQSISSPFFFLFSYIYFSFTNRSFVCRDSLHCRTELFKPYAKLGWGENYGRHNNIDLSEEETKKYENERERKDGKIICEEDRVLIKFTS